MVKLPRELQEADFGMLVNYLGSGRPAYHLRMMMGLVVYGVLQGKHSLRELEVPAATDIGAWLLCGGNHPGLSTIGDFCV